MVTGSAWWRGLSQLGLGLGLGSWSGLGSVSALRLLARCTHTAPYFTCAHTRVQRRMLTHVHTRAHTHTHCPSDPHPMSLPNNPPARVAGGSHVGHRGPGISWGGSLQQDPCLLL